MCPEPATSSECIIIIVLLPAELGLKSTQVTFIYMCVVVGVCYPRYTIDVYIIILCSQYLLFIVSVMGFFLFDDGIISGISTCFCDAPVWGYAKYAVVYVVHGVSYNTT